MEPNFLGCDRNSIVVTGMSGRFPESNTIDEFSNNLFNNVDMVTADNRRFEPGVHGLPERCGKLKDITNFDATFFGISPKQADRMDPQLRLLLETTYEAIVDAGYSMQELRGSRTGVFVGVSQSESDYRWSADPDDITGYVLLGTNRAMFANRISYSFDFKGPSYAIDTACSSSLLALNNAVECMRKGDIDAAVVAGANLCLRPESSLSFARFNMLSADGRCRTGDCSGSGYVRAETVGVVFLQRASAARRIYADLVHTKTNTDGFKELGITYPLSQMQHQLLVEVYREAGVSPSQVSYIEAHGTGTKVGDPVELNAIADLFCKQQEQQRTLLLGSVKSNMGHSEPGSGIASVVKVLLAIQHRMIPANLHYSSPNTDIPALMDGRIQIVDRNTQWYGDYIGVNSFGFGGANVHAIFKSPAHHAEQPEEQAVTTENGLTHSRLSIASGRTEEAVRSMLSRLSEREDCDEWNLIHHSHRLPIAGHVYRGYTLCGSGKINVQKCKSDRPEIWYICSGMGSQWCGMGRDLMQFDVFRASIERCSRAVAQFGLDLVSLINSDDEEKLAETIISFVMIASIQVSMIDMLSALGIRPDGIIGHSVGELGCSYADGCLTAEQTVLCAYWRGRSIVESRLITGAMAAVGMSWEQATARCPPDIYPACQNAADSVTVSGPKDSVHAFVAELQRENIFVRLVNSSDVAFHTKYIEEAAPKLKRSLDKVIPEPKRRSRRWLSTSLSPGAGDSSLAEWCSADYHVNNLTSPVLFHDALRCVAARDTPVVLIEIAPHALLASLLRRAVPSAVAVLGLNKRTDADNGACFLRAIGDLYCSGYQAAIQLHALYPPVSAPARRTTPSISSLVRWDHVTEWDVPKFTGFPDSRGSDHETLVDLSVEGDAYLVGHAIDGRTIYPATGYLVLVWKALAKRCATTLEETSVQFTDVKFLRATILAADAVKLSVSILNGSGSFEIREGSTLVVRGCVKLFNKEFFPSYHYLLENVTFSVDTQHALTTRDVYKELKLRGYDYRDQFQGILLYNQSDSCAQLRWQNNWVTLLDTMLQLYVLQEPTRSLCLPVAIRSLCIDSQMFAHANREKNSVDVIWSQKLDTVVTPGVQISGLKASRTFRRPFQDSPSLAHYMYVPLFDQSSTYTQHSIVSLFMDIVSDTFSAVNTLAVMEYGYSSDGSISRAICDHFNDIALISATCTVVRSPETVATDDSAEAAEFAGTTVLWRGTEPNPVFSSQQYHAIVVTSVNDVFPLQQITGSVHTNGYIISLNELQDGALEDYQLVARMVDTQSRAHYLYHRVRTYQHTVWFPIEACDTSELPAEHGQLAATSGEQFEWVPRLQELIELSARDNTRIFLLSTNCDGRPSGLVGLYNSLRLEPGGDRLRAVLLSADCPQLSAEERTVLATYDLPCVVGDTGHGWGTFRHVPLDSVLQHTVHTEHAFLNSRQRGDLSSLTWFHNSTVFDKETDQCEIYYAPLNFRDIMLASGKLSPEALPGDLASKECVLGLEFSGVLRGTTNRVMGLAPACALATHIQVDRDLLWEVPVDWSLEEAATVPVVYCTAYYALIVRGRLRSHRSILIHSGSGGVGQAAIAIALSMDCEVFTTVGSDVKKRFLLETFPKLKESNILHSRDLSFEKDIMLLTEGRGVHMVLNSLSEEKLMASVRCLAEHGVFLEIGKFDLSQDSPLGMRVFLKNITFHGILLDAIFGEGDLWAKHEVSRLMVSGLASSVVRPLPRTVYSIHEAEPAFRFMASGKHIGKVMLRIREDSSKLTLSAVSRCYADPAKVYIIVGGLGGFGLELADWLISRGARILVLTSRSGIKDNFQRMRVAHMRSGGARVEISLEDVCSFESARRLLQYASTLGSVDGIFNVAVVLRDGIFSGQNKENFSVVSGCKANATIFLDTLSREINCKWFVVFSSVSCAVGNPGQSNYAYANSVMERVVEKRVRDGLAGLAIQWGAIGDVGVFIDTFGDDSFAVRGTLPQKIRSCLQVLDEFMCYNGVYSSFVISRREAAVSSSGNILDAITNILGVKDTNAIDHDTVLVDLGLDSLMVVELSQIIERDFGVTMDANQIRSLTINKLVEMLSSESPQSAGEDGLSLSKSIDSLIASPVKSDRRYSNSILGEAIKSLMDDAGVLDLHKVLPAEQVLTINYEANDAAPLFIIHPIEGSFHLLSKATQLLTGTVYGIQCTLDSPCASIVHLAQHYLELVSKYIGSCNTFHLAGYSYGASVAYEMAIQWQNNATPACKIASLTLIDGSPTYVTRLISNSISSKSLVSANDREISWLLVIIASIVETNISKLKSEIEAHSSLEKRIKFIAHYLQSQGEFHNKHIMESTILSIYRRMESCYVYKPGKLLDQPIALIRAECNPLSDKIDEYYGLSEICTGKITTYPVSGNHLTCFDESFARIAEIINSQHTHGANCL